MLWGKHLYELKQRLGYILLSMMLTLVVCLMESESLLEIRMEPLLDRHTEDSNFHYIITGTLEVWTSRRVLSLVVTIVLALGVIYMMWYYFILPGLHKHESKEWKYLLIVS